MFSFVRKSMLCVLSAVFFAVLSFSTLCADPSEDKPGAEPESGAVLQQPEEGKAEAVPAPESFSPVSLLPAAKFLEDQEGRLTVEQAAEKRAEFVSWEPWGIRRGAVWMYVPLDDLRGLDKLPGSIWLCLGTQTSGGNEAWLSVDDGKWTRLGQSGRGLWRMEGRPDSRLMVRLSSDPGFWFSPKIRSSSSLAVMPEWLSLYGAILVLAVVALLGLLSAVPKRNDGIFWTALFAAAAGVHAWFCVPAAEVLTADTFFTVFSAALALMLLPHVGRAVMHTNRLAPKTDVFYLLLAVPGAACALLPFIPGFSWMARFLVFWPVIASFCFLPAFWLVFCGVPGSLHFATGCLFLIAGTGGAVWGLMSGYDMVPPLAFMQAGNALAAVLIASAPPFFDKQGERFVPAPLSLDGDEEDPVPDEDRLALVNGGLEKLLDESCRLDQALSNAGLGEEKVGVMVHADNMISTVKDIAVRLRDGHAEAALPGPESGVFELRAVIRNVLNSVHGEAEKKHLGLAWYVSPYINKSFIGCEERLTGLLSLLMADSVRASEKGSIMLHVSRPAESTDQGRLLFTIRDSGSGCSPQSRHSPLLARAWDFASEYGGAFLFRGGEHGAEISFEAKFDVSREPAGDRKALPAPAGSEKHQGSILVAARDGVKRHVLSWQLEGLGYALREAQSADAAADACREAHAELIVFHGDLRDKDIRKACSSIRSMEKERSLPAAAFLLLALDTDQAGRMKECGHSLVVPVPRKDMRRMVRWLLSPEESARPVMSGERITVADVLAGAKGGTAGMKRKVVVSEEKLKASAADVSGRTLPEHGMPGADGGALRLDGEGSPAGGDENAGLLTLDGAQKETGGWLGSVFGGTPRQGGTLSIDIDGGNVGTDGAPSGPSASGSRAGSRDAAVLGIEDQVVELTEADIVQSCKEEAGQEENGLPAYVTNESDVISGEEMEDPQGSLLSDARALEGALHAGRVKDGAQTAMNLARLAERYDLRTISDMAHCICAACGEGDLASAEQTCADLIAELERK